MSAETPDDALSTLQHRCRVQGLVLTPSRRAILSALQQQSEAHDAVPLLQAAQAYHASTSIGTVYRFLRELQQRGIVDAQVYPHERTRWQLRDERGAITTHDALTHLRAFFGALERLAVVESPDAAHTYIEHGADDADRTLALLQTLAEHLGYRWLPRPHPWI